MALQAHFNGTAYRREYEDLRREYEDLRREYEDLRYTHNLDANHNNVWKSTEHNNGKQHPTQKPIDLMERIILTSSKAGGVILDPFMGSGSTGVACANTGRNFIGIELDKRYFDIAQERIENARVIKNELGIRIPEVNRKRRNGSLSENQIGLQKGIRVDKESTC
jgi:DNA modification methylase